MARWDRITEKAMRFGMLLSKEIKVVNVDCDEGEQALCTVWDDKILAPIRKREGLPGRAGARHPALWPTASSSAHLIDYVFEPRTP